jgi:hypothetical protein
MADFAKSSPYYFASWKNDAEHVPMTTTEPADAMAQLNAMIGALTLLGAIIHCDDDRVALAQRHDFSTRQPLGLRSTTRRSRPVPARWADQETRQKSPCCCSRANSVRLRFVPHR